MRDKYIVAIFIIVLFALAIVQFLGPESVKETAKDKEEQTLSFLKLTGLELLDFGQMDAEDFSAIERVIRIYVTSKESEFMRVYFIGKVAGEEGKTFVYQPALSDFVKFSRSRLLLGIKSPSLVFAAAYPEELLRRDDDNFRQIHVDVINTARKVEYSLNKEGITAVKLESFDADELRKRLNLPEDQSPLYIISL